MPDERAARFGMTGGGGYPPLPASDPAAFIAAKTNLSDTSVTGRIVRRMSLFHPPKGFPPHLAYFWPLIWCQVLLLRAAVRAAYGRGVQYHWSVSPNGRVFLTSIDWLPSQKAERAWLAPGQQSSKRLAAACDGTALLPAYTRLCLEPADSTTAAPLRGLCPFAVAGNLPLPET